MSAYLEKRLAAQHKIAMAIGPANADKIALSICATGVNGVVLKMGSVDLYAIAKQAGLPVVEIAADIGIIYWPVEDS